MPALCGQRCRRLRPPRPGSPVPSNGDPAIPSTGSWASGVWSVISWARHEPPSLRYERGQRGATSHRRRRRRDPGDHREVPTASDRRAADQVCPRRPPRSDSRVRALGIHRRRHSRPDRAGSSVATVMVRRRFGSIRKLPSGRYQASFQTPDGKRESAPETFRTAADAARYLDRMQQEIERGHWLPDARLGRRTLRECCESYLEENPRVGERWAETCRRNMRLHLAEMLDLPVVAITPPVVRAWHAKALRGSGAGRRSASRTASSGPCSTSRSRTARSRVTPARSRAPAPSAHPSAGSPPRPRSRRSSTQRPRGTARLSRSRRGAACAAASSARCG